MVVTARSGRAVAIAQVLALTPGSDLDRAARYLEGEGQLVRDSRMSERAHLLSLATALPPHVLWQSEIAAKAHAVFGPYFEDFERLSGMFHSSGIVKRHGVKP